MCHQASSSSPSFSSSVSTSNIDFESDGQRIPAILAEPTSGETISSVVLFHDIWGANDFYRDFATRLAAEGFRVVLPDFFVREGSLDEPTMSAASKRRFAMDQEQGLRDLGAAIRFASNSSEPAESVSVVGFCMGGTYVMLSGSRDPLPSSVVAFYGFPAGSAGWPLRPLDEVGKMRSPMLYLVGDQDAGVGIDNVETYISGLEQAGKSIESTIYPATPHGFMTFDPDDDYFDQATDAWIKMVAFLSGQSGQ